MVIDVIRERKSVRNFVSEAGVSEGQIRELLEAAMLAPSACNSRPWKFIVVQNRGKLCEITSIHPYTQMLTTASCAIVVCADLSLQRGVSEGFFPQDCGAATQNILLQAAALGLGTCWCGIYPKMDKVKDFRSLFELPDSVVPFCVIAIGVPAEEMGGRGFYEEGKVTWIK